MSDESLTEWAERTALQWADAVWHGLELLDEASASAVQAARDAGLIRLERDGVLTRTPKGEASLAHIRRLAEGLDSTERMVLRGSPGLASAQPRLREIGLVAVDSSGRGYRTPRGRAVARYLESQNG